MSSINKCSEMTKPKYPRAPGEKPTPRNPVKPRIIAYMEPRKGYTSAGIAKDLGVVRMVVWQALHRMGKAGEIAVLPVGHDNLYFATQACANSFSAAERNKFADEQRAMRQATIARLSKALGERRNQVVKEKPGKPPNVTIKAPLLPKTQIVQTVDYSGAKVTICKAPNYDARYQVDPATRVVGGFATMGVGRYEG